MKINKNSPMPLYYQVKEIIIENIKNGNYPTNQAILTENEMIASFDVSRTTIRQAVNELISEGYLYRKRGIGTFVSSQHLNPSYNDYFSALNTDDLIKLNGKKLTKKIIEYHTLKPGKDICDLFTLPIGSDFYLFYRVEYGDEQPITFTRTYVPCIYINNLKKDLLEIENGFHNYLEKQGYTIEILDASVEIMDNYDELTLNTLKLEEGSPVLLLKSKNSTKDGTVIEYSSTAINYRNVYIPIRRRRVPSYEKQ